ncbi:TPA: hypothetical protein N0F65_004212, partial [Lagenidium giganteum]
MVAEHGLVDALHVYDNDNTQAGTNNEHHTYRYTTARGETSSPRLDRWYLPAPGEQWRVAVSTSIPGLPADHDGVLMAITDVSKAPRARPEPRQYHCNGKQRRSDYLLTAHQHLDVFHTDKAKVSYWEQCKADIHELLLSSKPEARAQMIANYRSKMRGLLKERWCLHQPSKPSERTSKTSCVRYQPRSQDTNTTERIRRIGASIQSLKAARINHQRRRMFSQYQGHTPTQQKAFHARFRPPRTDNYLGTLGEDPSLTGQRLADQGQHAWCPIMGAKPTDAEHVENWLQHYRPQHPLTATQQDVLVQEITSEEVRWSIRKCKRRKATGPDRLPNDFYRNLEDELIT